MKENIEQSEKQVKNNQKRNQKFIDEFENWLKEKKLTPKTINKHIGNIDLFLNDYLNYYDVSTMEEGIFDAVFFLKDWFIRKCMWVTVTSIKEMTSSLKKFYQCMSEKNYVSVEDYKEMCSELKNNMDDIFNTLERFDNLEEDEDLDWLF